MRAVLLQVPEAMLVERRKLGLDGRDEAWNGVLHMVPPPGGLHQELSGELYLVLGPIAKRHGVLPYFETGLFRAPDDYRVPDQLYCRPEHRSDRGADGAELVIEIRSDGDETYEKIVFYAGLGVREMLIVHPDSRRVELLRSVGGQLLPVSADGSGAVRCDVLGVQFATVAGRLRVTWDAGAVEL